MRRYNRAFSPCLCRTVRELYPRDFELHAAHCCHQPELADGPVPTRPARPVGVALQAPPRAFLAYSEGNPGAGDWALRSKPGQVQATKTKQTRTGEEANAACLYIIGESFRDLGTNQGNLSRGPHGSVSSQKLASESQVQILAQHLIFTGFSGGVCIHFDTNHTAFDELLHSRYSDYAGVVLSTAHFREVD